jgi:hypothetical protein
VGLLGDFRKILTYIDTILLPNRGQQDKSFQQSVFSSFLDLHRIGAGTLQVAVGRRHND